MGNCLLTLKGTTTATTTMRFILIVAIFCIFAFNNVLGKALPDNDVHFHVNMGSKQGFLQQKTKQAGDDYRLKFVQKRFNRVDIPYDEVLHYGMGDDDYD